MSLFLHYLSMPYLLEGIELTLEVTALGLDDEFRRMWDFYLAYCEAAFDEREISVVQCVLSRPGARVASVVDSPADKVIDLGMTCP